MSGEPPIPTSLPSAKAQPPHPPLSPRATPRGSTVSRKLTDLLHDRISTRRPGLYLLLGPPGSGKTTALQTLTQLRPTPLGPILTFDEADTHAALLASANSPVILATPKEPYNCHPRGVFELAPWDTDDCIAYIAQRSPADCPRILRAFAQHNVIAQTSGSPQLLAAIIDAALTTRSDPDPAELLADLISQHLSPDCDEIDSLNNIASLQLLDDNAAEPYYDYFKIEQVAPWWRHGVVREAFIARTVANAISLGIVPLFLASADAEALIDPVARAIRTRPKALSTLDDLVRLRPTERRVPIAASILIRASPGWRPASGRALHLKNAHLAGAQWPNLDLTGACLDGADLRDADLSHATLTGVDASRTRFARANLTGADLTDSSLIGSNFLSANLSGAVAHRANLSGSNLTGITACAAKLESAQLSAATLAGADFTDANCTAIKIRRADLRQALWTGASFKRASLVDCNFEGLDLSHTDFTSADLCRSLFTNTRAHQANFTDADLHSAGLADIDWTGANLHKAILTHASFHLGSSRAGLVECSITPTPVSEGTRTGFYTDEFNEQTYKAPEEIRKACLVGANLTDAITAGVDFYLVDLRHARYSEDQGLHFRRCGAILAARPC